MRKNQTAEALTVSEPLSVTLAEGSVVEGALWTHPSGKGRFKVSYAGRSKLDVRAYMSVEHTRSVATIALREMAEGRGLR
jgi:hypothetical protein